MNPSSVLDDLRIFHVETTIVGCAIPGRMRGAGEETLLKWGKTTLDHLLRLQSGLPFIVGDFCNGLRDLCETWEQILPDVYGIGVVRTLKTLQNWASVLDRYAIEERKWPLPFSHYAEVAYVKDKDLREMLLQSAYNSRLSVEQLRELKKAMTQMEDDHEEEDFDTAESDSYPRAVVVRTLTALSRLLPPEMTNYVINRAHEMYDDPDMLALFDLLRIEQVGEVVAVPMEA